MSKPEFTNFTVWNMNGGPIPSSLADSLERAIEALIKEYEEKDGIRMLYSFAKTEEA